MEESKLPKIVEWVIQQSKNSVSRKRVIPQDKFLELLNCIEQNPDFKISLNKETPLKRYFTHKLEYKGFSVISSIERPIYNSDEEFYKDDLIDV